MRFGDQVCRPEELGDVILGRKDCAASYHIAVVVDDAAQGVTHVSRGEDLFPVTGIHRTLQALLGLPVPQWYHHRQAACQEGQEPEPSGNACRRDAAGRRVPADAGELRDFHSLIGGGALFRRERQGAGCGLRFSSSRSDGFLSDAEQACISRRQGQQEKGAQDGQQIQMPQRDEPCVRHGCRSCQYLGKPDENRLGKQADGCEGQPRGQGEPY